MSLAEWLSRSVIAMSEQSKVFATSAAVALYASRSSSPVVTSVPWTSKPSTDWMSSSLAMTTSTHSINGRITDCAFFEDHSFLRKLRSMLTVAPAALAACSASFAHAAPLSPSAGVMPVQWNHVAPSNTRVQSTVPGVISATADRARS